MVVMVIITRMVMVTGVEIGMVMVVEMAMGW